MSDASLQKESVPRKAKSPKGGKGSAVLIRVTSDTRAALEAEAARSGRSLSQTAEIWLDEARNGRAQYHQLLGSHAAAAQIEKLADIARDVHEQTKSRREAEIALRAAWLLAVSELLPEPEPVVNWLAHSLKIGEAWQSCRAVLLALDTVDPADPVHRRATGPLHDAGGPLSSKVIAQRLADVLKEPDQINAFPGFRAPDHEQQIALNALRKAGPAARREIDVALDLVGDLMAQDIVARAKIRDASNLGAAIAHSVVMSAR